MQFLRKRNCFCTCWRLLHGDAWFQSPNKYSTIGIDMNIAYITCNKGCHKLMYVTVALYDFIFLQKCPDSNADFRSEQCKTFGEKMVPFIDESDPCKLMCRSQEQNPDEKGTVVDGTPCLTGGVCVGGDCVVSYNYDTLSNCWHGKDRMCVNIQCTPTKLLCHCLSFTF